MAQLFHPVKPQAYTYNAYPEPRKPDLQDFMIRTRSISIDTDLVIEDLKKPLLDVLIENDPKSLALKEGETYRHISISSESYSNYDSCCNSGNSSKVNITVEVNCVISQAEQKRIHKQFEEALKRYNEEKKKYDEGVIRYNEAVEQYNKDLEAYNEQQKKIKEFVRKLK